MKFSQFRKRRIDSLFCHCHALDRSDNVSFTEEDISIDSTKALIVPYQNDRETVWGRLIRNNKDKSKNTSKGHNTEQNENNNTDIIMQPNFTSNDEMMGIVAFDSFEQEVRPFEIGSTLKFDIDSMSAMSNISDSPSVSTYGGSRNPKHVPPESDGMTLGWFGLPVWRLLETCDAIQGFFSDITDSGCNVLLNTCCCDGAGESPVGYAVIPGNEEEMPGSVCTEVSDDSSQVKSVMVSHGDEESQEFRERVPSNFEQEAKVEDNDTIVKGCFIPNISAAALGILSYGIEMTSDDDTTHLLSEANGDISENKETNKNHGSIEKSYCNDILSKHLPISLPAKPPKDDVNDDSGDRATSQLKKDKKEEESQNNHSMMFQIVQSKDGDDSEYYEILLPSRTTTKAKKNKAFLLKLLTRSLRLRRFDAKEKSIKHIDINEVQTPPRKKLLDQRKHFDESFGFEDPNQDFITTAKREEMARINTEKESSSSTFADYYIISESQTADEIMTAGDSIPRQSCESYAGISSRGSTLDVFYDAAMDVENEVVQANSATMTSEHDDELDYAVVRIGQFSV